MNILIANDSYPTAKTPFAAFLSVLIKEFVRRGHNVIVIAPQSLTKHWFRHYPLNPTEYEDIYYVNGGKRTVRVFQPFTITFGGGRFRHLTLSAQRWAFNRVYNRIKQPIDTLYAQFWASAFYMLDAKLNHPNLPLYVDCGEDVIDFHYSLTAHEKRQLSDAVNGVICVSSKCKEESISAQLATTEKCKIFVNGIEPNVFRRMDCNQLKKELGIQAGDFTLAFVGRFIHRKGVGRIVKALKSLNDQTIKLILIGRPDEREKEDIDYNGIVFCGQVPHDEIPQYLNCADVYVFPTLAEGCSNSLIEAMACGLPIISSDMSFNHDILNEENAILIDPMNVSQIAQAIQTLKNDPNMRKEMSKAALKMSEELTITKRVDKILEFIQK